jgi:hypothetical protein
MKANYEQMIREIKRREAGNFSAAYDFIWTF